VGAFVGFLAVHHLRLFCRRLAGGHKLRVRQFRRARGPSLGVSSLDFPGAVCLQRPGFFWRDYPATHNAGHRESGGEVSRGRG
jgi:hypothetical protein